MAKVDSGFVLSHSRVALDIDFVNSSVQGIVELTVTPLVSTLTELYLHCRQCVILSVKVDGILASYVHTDPDEDLINFAKAGSFSKLSEMHLSNSKKPDNGELYIQVPPELECEKMQFEQATLDSSACYRSWTLVIEYIIQQPEVAITFVVSPTDVVPEKRAYPHMFIAPVHNQARWWMPCTDKIHDRLTYEFEITIPRTVSDVYSLSNGYADINHNGLKTLSQRQSRGLDHSLKMVAVCSGELVEQFVHPENACKSVWIYSIQTAMDAASVILAAGPFEILPIHGWGRPTLTTLRNTESALSDEELFENGIQRVGGKGLIFVLPDYKRDIRVSTFFLSQALEFFEQWTGSSFPFSSFKLVFVKESYPSIVTGSTIALASVDILVDETMIDQVYETRLHFAKSLASQWFGHYMAPNRWTDVWVLVGFTNWLAALFMRKMFGNNEFKYRLQQDINRVCELDVNQPPLCPDVSILGGAIDEDGSPAALTISSLISRNFYSNDSTFSARTELMMLKSPLVLNMLEKRMGKNLLQKIANKLMVSAMSGELPTGLSTTHFLKMVRKISGKLETKEFADQWIFRSGCPIFTIRYHFNRKKMVIELRVKQDCSNVDVIGANQRFSGAFMVRVQEPGGTFDTEVRIEEKTKQYDIIYHTKYKRIRRRAGKKYKKVADNDDDDDDEDVYYMEEDEKANDAIADAEAQNQDTNGNFNIIEPDRITFEWIRLDPDNVWICTKTFEQEDFMWNALLRKEKDIGAQSEAIVALSKIQSLASLNTITTFVRDHSHFYHLRLLAVSVLSKFDSDELYSTALGNLIKIYRDIFCISYDGPIIPKKNNFSSLQDYKLRLEIVRSLAKFVDARGATLPVVRMMFVNLLKYNDNSGNEVKIAACTEYILMSVFFNYHYMLYRGQFKYSDGEWVSLLVKLIGDAFIIRPRQDMSAHARTSKRSVLLASTDVEDFEILAGDKHLKAHMSDSLQSTLSPEDQQLFAEAHVQILRQFVRDKVIPSHQNAVTVSCLETLLKWQLVGLLPINLMLFLGYSRVGNFISIRRMAVECLIVLSSMGNSDITEYLVYLVFHESDRQFRYNIFKSMVSFFSISMYGHKPSVTIEQAVTTLSKHAVFLASRTAKEIRSPTSPRLWLLFLRLSEMAAECLESDPELYQLAMACASTVHPSGITLTLSQSLLSGKFNQNLKNQVPAYSQANTSFHSSMEGVAVVPSTSRAPLRMTFSGSNSSVSQNQEAETLQMDMNISTPSSDQKSSVFSNSNSVSETGTKKRSIRNRLIQQRAQTDDSSPAKSFVSTPVAGNTISTGSARSRQQTNSNTRLSFNTTSILQAQSLERMILDELMIRKDAAIFLYPVDATMYPDYYEKIEFPIDLHTIRERVQNSEYGSFQDFEKDIHQLFTNCFIYNKKGTMGHAVGKSLEAFYSRRSKKKDGMPTKGQRNVGSLFTTWDIPQFPKSLPIAIARAERREHIRLQLHKLQNKRSSFASGALGVRQRYSRVLGQIGYEQLPLLPLQDIPEVEVHRDRRLQADSIINTNTNIDNSIQQNAEFESDTVELRENIRAIVTDIESLAWLSAEERQQLVKMISAQQLAGSTIELC
ncbi:hypothetical protein BATDEDRAFT_86202 [Batrachochytrium dendrobatidis JAM81]|uniref:Transcription initiation factor TFIID subunit 2 n=1 Tax=Batrachochytrium dendrobatidis (strain JAM81 / FGSC 10211) TaxID=684364 RepID=F4NW12_BATDJ|nr:uncharacterized protein BATDEDRAFT_86202 [Batrachochytrium dendrobatidis JAM81]EGF82398.1 hypothetical protein BATDEDRAFT_86202 [Batrachochytrium dendrobatidis JAM81]|eukprot:XP_006676911.1 hypothetical protein BATDEDRAFT_86202 [Batrachochytrium dendrobatidis JAM81]